MPTSDSKTNTIHTLFDIGIGIKGVHALFNLIGALSIYSISNTTLVRLAQSVTAHELLQDPHDHFANSLLNHAGHFTDATKDFAILYLLVSALINIVLVIGLFSHKRVMFPIAIGIIGIFVGYQVYVFLHTLSWWLLGIALYDCFVIGIVAAEYRRQWPPAIATKEKITNAV